LCAVTIPPSPLRLFWGIVMSIEHNLLRKQCFRLISLRHREDLSEIGRQLSPPGDFSMGRLHSTACFGPLHAVGHHRLPRPAVGLLPIAELVVPRSSCLIPISHDLGRRTVGPPLADGFNQTLCANDDTKHPTSTVFVRDGRTSRNRPGNVSCRMSRWGHCLIANTAVLNQYLA
jgi:hypothetical protein